MSYLAVHGEEELKLLNEIRQSQLQQEQLKKFTLIATGAAFLFTMVRMGDLLIQMKRRKQ